MAIEVDITPDGFIMIILTIASVVSGAIAWLYNKSNKQTRVQTRMEDRADFHAERLDKLEKWMDEESKLARKEHAKIYENQNEINKLLHRIAGKIGIE